jgi:hypothetical protein
MAKEPKRVGIDIGRIPELLSIAHVERGSLGSQTASRMGNCLIFELRVLLGSSKPVPFLTGNMTN